MSELERICKILQDYETVQLKRAVRAYRLSPGTFLDELSVLEQIVDARRKLCEEAA